MWRIVIWKKENANWGKKGSIIDDISGGDRLKMRGRVLLQNVLIYKLHDANAYRQ